MQPNVIRSLPVDSWNICVMTRGEIYFANTEGAIKGYGLSLPGAMYDVAALLRDVGDAFADRDEGLLLVPVLPGAGAIDDGLPETDSLAWRWSRMESAALQAGWQIAGDSGRIRDNGWVVFRHQLTGRKIIMGILTMIDQNRTPLFDLTASAEHICQRVMSYAAVTGVLWRMTAGVSGCVSLRADRADRAQRQLTLTELREDPEEGQPHWRWDGAPAELHGAGHMIWTRPLTPAERVEGASVVSFDVRGQFLAAMVSGRYGWGVPTHRGPIVFDLERAGFWQISTSGVMSLDGPPIIRYQNGNGLTWVTTPVMTYLLNRGIEPLVYDSWTSATSSQWLKPWAAKIRDALYAESLCLQDIEPALKRTYAETNGMFNVPGGSIYRKDLHWTTADTGAMNLRRKIDKVHAVMGMWPCKIYHDAVSWPVPDYSGYLELSRVLGMADPTATHAPPARIGKLRYTGRVAAREWETNRMLKQIDKETRA